MTDTPIETKVNTLTGNLKTLHTQLFHESIAARVIADRARTLDQIKRLYAVVMAFALTTSVGNAYLCERALETKTLAARVIIFGPVFCLGSILILFCLGAERFLDLKYVQLKSKRATWQGLALDLATLGATAGVFVVLANSFQPLPFADQPPTLGGRLTMADLSRELDLFLFNLIVLCAVDVVCLATQCASLKRQDEHGNKVEPSAAYNAHRTWTLTNVGMLVIFFLLYRFETSVAGIIGVAGIATALVLVHLVRFLIDFRSGFDLYYPMDELPDPGLLLEKSP